MPMVKFVPVIPLTEFTGENVEELPLDNYVNMCGPDTGIVAVADGVVTISWPSQFAQPTVTIVTGDFVDSNGLIYSADTVAAMYVRLSDLGGLL